MLAEGVCTASYMNGFWSRWPHASRRSLHRFKHAISWLWNTAWPCCIRSFRSHNNKRHSVTFVRQQQLFLLDQNRTESTTKERLVPPSTVKRSSSRPLRQEHECCRSAQPNFPAHSKRHRNAYHQKQRLSSPQRLISHSWGQNALKNNNFGFPVPKKTVKPPLQSYRYHLFECEIKTSAAATSIEIELVEGVRITKSLSFSEIAPDGYHTFRWAKVAVRCSWLVVRFAELEVNGLPALDSSCDPDGSVVWTSIFRSERTLPCWGGLEVRQWPAERENCCDARSNGLCSFCAIYAFFLMTFLGDDFWQTFPCATNFWICFSWAVRQKLSDKVRL